MPLELILVRHGESVGNVAREEAEAAGAEVIAAPHRDPDVALSALGEQQASALGDWLTADSNTPDAVWSSPYVRARTTAEVAVSRSGLSLPIRTDERLRDRELGVLDLLTAHGVVTRFPNEAQRRQWLGKFYYRPPGGESWADVALRLRSFLSDLMARGGAGRQLIFTHDAVILLFRYVCEQLDEAQLFDIARSGSLINTSVTRMVPVADGQPWKTTTFNDHTHLDVAGVEASEHPGDPHALPQ